MKSSTAVSAFLLIGMATGVLAEAGAGKVTWRLGPPLLLPGEPGAFDEVAVKDPSIVYFSDAWHVFYTARSKAAYSLGYASAPRLEALQGAERHQLSHLGGRQDGYAAAPQVFFFEPQQRWYLVYQTRDANYQPVYATTTAIAEAGSWSGPKNLVEKSDRAKWIDFWVICDDEAAYLFYTRDHQEVYVMTAALEEFPDGFGNPRSVFGPVHEAVHIYRAAGLDEYHLFYELRGGDGLRRFGLATAPGLDGPWTRQTDDYATGAQVEASGASALWTEEISHGEMIRSGYDQWLSYDPVQAQFLIQGMRASEHQGDYTGLPWKLGIIRKE